MIGLFDSGYGGLTVLKWLLKKLPQYDYLYLGDSARVPYGSRSTETIRQFSEEAILYFIKEKVPLVIIACNTSSAAALRYLQGKYSDQLKILGVIRPLAEYAARKTKKKKIGVVGTRATIQSKAYEEEIKKLDHSIKIFGQACQLLVPLIEEGWHKKPETKMILRKYLRKLKSHNIDTLILGCTHYPVLYDDFERIMGAKTEVLDSGKIIAESLKNYLERHPEIEKKIQKTGTVEFLTTDDPLRFREMGEQFLQQSMKKIDKIIL